jgi:hypothetical protein
MSWALPWLWTTARSPATVAGTAALCTRPTALSPSATQLFGRTSRTTVKLNRAMAGLCTPVWTTQPLQQRLRSGRCLKQSYSPTADFSTTVSAIEQQTTPASDWEALWR